MPNSFSSIMEEIEKNRKKSIENFKKQKQIEEEKKVKEKQIAKQQTLQEKRQIAATPKPATWSPPPALQQKDVSKIYPSAGYRAYTPENMVKVKISTPPKIQLTAQQKEANKIYPAAEYRAYQPIDINKLQPLKQTKTTPKATLELPKITPLTPETPSGFKVNIPAKQQQPQGGNTATIRPPTTKEKILDFILPDISKSIKGAVQSFGTGISESFMLPEIISALGPKTAEGKKMWNPEEFKYKPQNTVEEITKGIGEIAPYAVTAPISGAVTDSLTKAIPSLAKSIAGRAIAKGAGTAALGTTVKGVQETIKATTDTEPMTREKAKEIISNVGNEALLMGMFGITSETVGKKVGEAVARKLPQIFEPGVKGILSRAAVSGARGAATGGTTAIVTEGLKMLQNPDNINFKQASLNVLTTAAKMAALDIAGTFKINPIRFRLVWDANGKVTAEFTQNITPKTLPYKEVEKGSGLWAVEYYDNTNKVAKRELLFDLTYDSNGRIVPKASAYFAQKYAGTQPQDIISSALGATEAYTIQPTKQQQIQHTGATGALPVPEKQISRIIPLSESVSQQPAIPLTGAIEKGGETIETIPVQSTVVEGPSQAPEVIPLTGTKTATEIQPEVKMVEPKQQKSTKEAKQAEEVKKEPWKMTKEEFNELAVQRTEEPGVERATVNKPQGIYTTPLKYTSPHKDLGGNTYLWLRNPNAKVLNVDASELIKTNRGLVGQSAGIAALRKLLGEEEANRLLQMPQGELIEFLKQKYPNVEWGRYYDAQEMLEGYAGLLAREAGYDAIYAIDKKAPEFTEYVALTDKAIIPVSSHKEIIAQALKEGKPVPEEVLKDYPDLQAQQKSQIEVKSQTPTKEKTIDDELKELIQNYGKSGKAIFNKIVKQDHIMPGTSDMDDFIGYFEKYYNAGINNQPMPQVEIHPDVAGKIYEAGKKDFISKQNKLKKGEKKQAEEIFKENKILGDLGKPNINKEPETKSKELEKEAQQEEPYKPGDRVTYYINGKQVTGTVEWYDPEYRMIEVKVDQIATVGGVPIFRKEVISIGYPSLEKIGEAESSNKITKTIQQTEKEKEPETVEEAIKAIDTTTDEREKVFLYQKLGQLSTGVRLEDAEITGKLRYMLEKGEITKDEWGKYVDDLISSGKIYDTKGTELEHTENVENKEENKTESIGVQDVQEKEAEKPQTFILTVKHYSKSPEWVAKITGYDARYKYKREFLKPIDRDWSSSGKTGTTKYELDDGYYDIKDGFNRYFAKVENGTFTTVKQEEIEKYVESLKPEAKILKDLGKGVEKKEEKSETEKILGNIGKESGIIKAENTKGVGDNGGIDQIRGGRTSSLEEIPSENVSGIEGEGETGTSSDSGTGVNKTGTGRTDRSGTELRPGVGNGEGKVHLSANGEGRTESGNGPEPVGDTGESRRRERAINEAQKIDQNIEPGGENYIITENDNIGAGGAKTKYKNNVEAIKTLKQVESEGRPATPQEQSILVKYVGWGGLPQVFDFDYHGNPRQKDWHDEALELKNLLTKEEYRSAYDSVNNAHYTSSKVIKAMWDIAQQLGFKGGRVLEPAMGIGHFFGIMPVDLSRQSKLTGIELDDISGRISKLLYPKADVRIQGFEKTLLPNDFYDLAISNVPFGDNQIIDPEYSLGRKKYFNLHNYFFAKSLDKVRPGGIIMYITSRYTMDSMDTSAREYIAKRANLIGAIRLPNNAFKENARTEVVTDLIILQKKGNGIEDNGVKWIDTKQVSIDDNTYTVNEYFINHPEMILGKQSGHGGMYTSREYTVEPDGRDIAQAISEISNALPKDIIPKETHKATEPASVKELIPAPDFVKDGAYFIKDNMVYRRIGSFMEKMQFKPLKGGKMSAEEKRIRAMIPIRDAARKILSLELDESTPEAELAKTRKELNEAYDRYVEEFGPLHSRGSAQAFGDDPDYPLLLSLEHYDPDTEKAEKAAIFSQRTINPHKKAKKVDTAKEALLISLNEHNKIDWDYMMQLTGKDKETLRNELKGRVFLTPTGEWQTAEDYLSGNVRAKLKQAEAAAMVDKAFEENVKALKEVQPTDVKPEEISVRLGVPWIPEDDIRDFIAHILGDVYEGNIIVTYNKALDTWKITVKSQYLKKREENTRIWGTKDRTALQLIELALNNKTPVVTREDPETGKRYIDEKATTLAVEMQSKIQKEFENWLWSDKERTERLTKIYNETYRNLRLREYDGSHLTLPGINPVYSDSGAMPLRKHQKNAIWRILQNDRVLLAHAVGAGKTFEMVAGAMELKRLGLIKKPMFVVPNHLVEQWGGEFLRLYPGANVLVATHKQFEKSKRKEFINKVATGDWDAIIMPESFFGKIAMSPDYIRRFYQKQVDELEEVIKQEAALGQRSDRGLVKEIKNAQKKLIAKMEKKIQAMDKDYDILYFDQLGIDALFVDEAHRFKNLFFATRMTRVLGLGNKKGSDKAFDLFTKVRYIQEINGRVVFATGTPVANTMAEMYIMQKYLTPEMLEECGINSFDSWAAMFGRVVPTMEMKPSGNGFRVTNRFAQFVNIGELVQMFRSFADVIVSEQLDIPRPELETGKRILITAPARPELKDFIKELDERLETIHSGKVDPRVDNALKIISEGRKAALDMRLLFPELPDYPESKVNKAVENITKIYKETEKDRLTQIVFLDLSTPKPKDTDKDTDEETEDDMTEELSNVYDDMKKKLIKQGVKEYEIAFIHDYKTDAQKQKLFNAMNAGKVRILIGSTEKMGVGMNVQKRLIALHHLDCPWRPADLEQREGRILRQGNMNKKVKIFVYNTLDSLDARMWDILESKAKFITDVMTKGIDDRIAEDVSMTVLNYAEIKALTTSNPLLREQIEVQAKVRKLKMLKDDYDKNQRSMKMQLQWLPDEIKRLKENIKAFEKDLADAKSIDLSGDNFEITIGKTVYKKRADAGLKIVDLFEKYKDKLQLNAIKNKEATITIGRYGKFELYLDYNGLNIKGERSYFVNRPTSDIGIIRSLEYTVNHDIEKKLKQAKQDLQNEEHNLQKIEKEINKPFEYEEELQKLSQRLKEINQELGVDEPESPIMFDDGNESEEDIEDMDGELAYEMVTQAFMPKAPKQNKSEAQKILGNLGHPSVASTVKKSDIIKELSELLGIPVRIGRFAKARQGALGIFKPKEEVIRLKTANDIPTVSHEVGHALDKLMNLSKLMRKHEAEYTRLSSKVKGPKIKEAIAEFIRLYLTDVREAINQAPLFYEDFMEKLNEFPEVKEILTNAQIKIQQWQNLSPKEKVMSMISIGEKPKKERMTLERFYTAMVDELYPIQKYVNEVTKGMKIAAKDNPFIKAWLARGWKGKAEAKIHRGIYKDGKKISDSLNEILSPVEDNLDDFRAWMISRRALELSKRNIDAGISKEDALGTLKQIYQELGKDKAKLFVETGNKLVKFQNALIDELVESGYLSKQSAAKMKSQNKYYIPFYRVFDDSVKTIDFAGKTFANLPNRIKRIKGSGRDIIDPLESVIKNVYTFTNLAERNNVANSIIDLAEKYEGSGKWVEKVDAPISATKFQLEEIKKVLEAAGADVDSIDLSQMAAIFRPNARAIGKENIVIVYRNGKPEMYQLHPDLYRAVLFLDEESTNLLSKIMSYPASILRTGAVLNPEFPAKNIMRDQFTAFVFSKYGYIPLVDTFRGLSHILKKDDLYWQWYESGGAHSAMVSLDRNYLQKSIKEMFAKDKNLLDKAKNIIMHPIDALRVFSELAEEATRVREFELGLKKGASIEEAALASRDITIDFGRAGYIGKTANRYVAFLNAGIQGMDKLRRQFKEDPFGTTFKAIVILLIPTLITYLLNRKNEYYEARPQWEKDIFWLIPLPGTGGKYFLRIPKPFELGIIFSTIPERFLQWADKKDPKAFDDLYDTINQNMLMGILPDERIYGIPFSSGLIPTAFLPIMEAYANRSTFKRAPIVPAHEQDLLPYMQYGPYTTETAKLIGRLTGTSPRMLEHLTYGYTGGLGRDVLQGVDVILGNLGAVEIKSKPAGLASDIPVLKGLISGGIEAGQSPDINTFYEDYNRAQTIQKTIKAANEAGKIPTITKREAFLVEKLPIMRKIADYLSETRRQIEAITESKELSPKEKRRMIEELNKEQINLVRRAYGKKPIK